MTSSAWYVHQVNRPEGFPSADDFTLVQAPVPTPGPGTALVANTYLSVDPYMRGSMRGDWALHAPLTGRVIGRVVESRDPELAVGDLVFHQQSWRTHAVLRRSEVRVLPRPEGVPLRAFLSVLGGTGLSAYVGLAKIARVRPGDAVFISAAAGGVGTAAGQIARLLGATTVIGSAGSPAKVRHLVADLGFDAAFDYHDGPVTELLAKAAPDGVDVYLDNVGGDHLAAAIDALRDRGRIAWCGAIAQYNTTEPPAAPHNLFDVVRKSLRMEGFLVRDYRHVQDELQDFLIPHLQSGRVVPDDTVVRGIEKAVDAFLGMLRGANTGKMIVQVADECAATR